MSLPNFDQEWDYSDPISTRLKFIAMYHELKDSAPESYQEELNTQIARTHSLNSEFDVAHNILDNIEKYPELKSHPQLYTRYLLERGRTFNSSGEKEKAYKVFEEAYKFSDAKDLDYHCIDAAHMMAIAAPNLGKKIESFQNGIKQAEATEETRAKKWLGALYNNLGWDFHENQRFDEALEIFQKAKDYHLEFGTEQTQFVASWTIARCLRSLKRNDEAMKIQKEFRGFLADG